MLQAKSVFSWFGSRHVSSLLRGLMLLSLLSVSTAGAAASPPATKYNLLVISIDTCRADHLACYGYNRDTSPHLDQLAREGVLFENLTAAASWTVPSHMSMFTSLYPSVHGVQTFTSQLGEGVPTLAQCLAQSGYVTAAFVTGPVLNHYFGFNRGFQYYDDFTADLTFDNTQSLTRMTKGTSVLDRVITNPIITNLATQWLKVHSRDNFFLFLHYWDCHYDYIPPAPFDKKFDPDYQGPENGRDILKREPEIVRSMSARDLAHMVALYDGEIAHTDGHVGKVLELLQNLGLSEKTLVIVVSDHGEAFLEHGRIRHANSLYEEVLHVPLIMRLPGVIPAGKRVAGNVSHVDLMPTALGLLHLPGPAQIQGIDLSPAILSDQPVPERLIYSELAFNGLNLRAVRWGNRKLLGPTGTVAGAELEELAGNREKVIAGWMALAKVCPEVAIRAFLKGPLSIPAANATKANEPDAELIKRLKSLGYTQ
ncbi:MAG: sulfatase [Candidatus Brocadiia bacterium]|jgi:arylsulfatase A-like enzyme